MPQKVRIVCLYCGFAAAALFGTTILWGIVPTSHAAAFDEAIAANAGSLPEGPEESPGDFLTTEAFVAATKSGRRIIFVDGYFSCETQGFRPCWQEFRDREATDAQAQTVVPGTESEAPLFRAAGRWLCENDIWIGGYKTYGGAGRVVWIEDGTVRDFAWCQDLNSADEIAERTRAAFANHTP